MKDLIDIVENLIKTSRDLYSKSVVKPEAWKMCLILEKEGWRLIEVEPIEDSTDIMSIWSKADQRQKLRLTLEDQYRWLKSSNKEQ